MGLSGVNNMPNESKWLTPNQITEIVPSRMRHRNISENSIRRWQLKGIQGIFLRSALVGGVRCSTLEDVENFVNALTERDYDRRFHPCDKPQLTRPPASKIRRKLDRANKEAEDLGL